MEVTVGYDLLAKMRHRRSRGDDVPYRRSRIKWSRVAIYAALVVGPWSAIALLVMALSG